MHDIKRTKVQEIVASSREASNSLLKELEALKKEAMEDRDRIVKDLREKGLLDDIFAYLKEEADKGDRVSLNVFNFWKHGKLPK